MLKQIIIAITAVGLMTVPAFADDLGPSKNASGFGVSPDALNLLQPATPSGLQPTGAVTNSSNPGAATNGTSTLQPAGTTSDSNKLVVSSADGGQQSAATPDNRLANDLLLGAAGLGFLITAAIIFRTSKRLESLEQASTSDTESLEFPAAPAADPSPRKRKPKKPKSKPTER